MIRAVEERGVNTVRVQVLMIGEATSEHHRPSRSLLWYSTELTVCLGTNKSSRRLITGTGKVDYDTITLFKRQSPA